jgi:hypothetical protein
LFQCRSIEAIRASGFVMHPLEFAQQVRAFRGIIVAVGKQSRGILPLRP